MNMWGDQPPVRMKRITSKVLMSLRRAFSKATPCNGDSPPFIDHQIAHPLTSLLSFAMSSLSERLMDHIRHVQSCQFLPISSHIK